MRKGSTKLVKIPEPNPIQKPPTTPKEPNGGVYEYPSRLVIKLIVDVLLRICDACHDMQNESEPWASIRKDIEKLR
jgi:hypothetical protein